MSETRDIVAELRRCGLATVLEIANPEHPKHPLQICNQAADEIESLRSALATAEAAALERATWRPIEAAPKDGTLLLLLMEHSEDDTSDHPTEDEKQWRTIGFNGLDNTGDDEWFIAGWCWDHDHYAEGHGKPVGWMPLPPASGHSPAPAGEAETYDHPDGGRYIIVERGVLKHPTNGEWVQAIAYRDIKGGPLCMTTARRWEHRFTLASSLAQKEPQK